MSRSDDMPCAVIRNSNGVKVINMNNTVFGAGTEILFTAYPNAVWTDVKLMELIKAL